VQSKSEVKNYSNPNEQRQQMLRDLASLRYNPLAVQVAKGRLGNTTRNTRHINYRIQEKDFPRLSQQDV
jgi:hypothetical protein